jgi:hypothetical protein
MTMRDHMFWTFTRIKNPRNKNSKNRAPALCEISQQEIWLNHIL